MAYGIDRNSYLIREGRLSIGTWSPGGITNNDPTAAFTGGADIGDFQQGTFAPELTRAYAEFLVGTPAILSRKDLTRKQWMWSATFAQYNTDLLALVQGLDVTTGIYDIAYIGSDEVTQDYNGYLQTTALVDGRLFYEALFYGKVTAEAVGPAFPGTAHSTYGFKAEAFPDPYYAVTSPNDVRNYGCIILGPTLS